MAVGGLKPGRRRCRSGDDVWSMGADVVDEEGSTNAGWLGSNVEADALVKIVRVPLACRIVFVNRVMGRRKHKLWVCFLHS